VIKASILGAITKETPCPATDLWLEILMAMRFHTAIRYDTVLSGRWIVALEEEHIDSNFFPEYGSRYTSPSSLVPISQTARSL
jgi:hypothetical protein